MVCFKCKNCGGDLIPDANGITGCCEYCGSTFTLPNEKEEERIMQVNRANKLRMGKDFDRAIQAYEKLIGENDSDPELYWNLLICKYGIEYVKDPETGVYKPTCHRARYESIMADINYKEVMRLATPLTKAMYQVQAQEIDTIIQAILAKAAQQEKYDIFLSYKESDNGERTIDSVHAERLFKLFQEKGYKTFYAPETLTAGKNFEAEIFSALQSSKVMILLGTCLEYMNAPWVKNEWSRYLELISQGKDKTLIPAYWDMDPAEDFPQEIKNFKYQGINMGSATGEFTLLSNVEKLLGKKNSAEPARMQASVGNGNQADALCTRGYIHLDDRHFDDALNSFNRSLDLYPEYGKAYWGLLLAKRHFNNAEMLISAGIDLSDDTDYKNAVKFSKAEEKEHYVNVNEAIKSKQIGYMRSVHDKITVPMRTKIAELKDIKEKLAALKLEVESYREQIAASEGELQILAQKQMASSSGVMKKLKGCIDTYNSKVQAFKSAPVGARSLKEEKNIAEQLNSARSDVMIAVSEVENHLSGGEEGKRIKKIADANKTILNKEISSFSAFEGLSQRATVLENELNELKNKEEVLFADIKKGKLDVVNSFINS